MSLFLFLQVLLSATILCLPNHINSQQEGAEAKLNASFWTRPTRTIKGKDIPVFEDKLESYDVELLSHNAVTNFAELLSNSKILFEFLQDLNSFIAKVRSDLSSEHLFLSGLINLHFLSKFEAEVRATFDHQNNTHFISSELKKLFKIAKNKIGHAPIGSDIAQYKFYLDELDQQRFTFFNAAEDLRVFLKHIKNELSVSGQKASNDTSSTLLTTAGCYKDGIKDLYLILEHPIIQIDPLARADVVKTIQTAYKKGELFFSHSEILPYKEYMLEITNKALNLQSEDELQEKIFKEAALRTELINLQNKIFSSQPTININQQPSDIIKKDLAINKMVPTKVSSQSFKEQKTKPVQAVTTEPIQGVIVTETKIYSQPQENLFKSPSRHLQQESVGKRSKNKTTQRPAIQQNNLCQALSPKETYFSEKTTSSNSEAELKIKMNKNNQGQNNDEKNSITTTYFNEAKDNALKALKANRKKESGVNDKAQKKYCRKNSKQNE